MAQVDAEPDVTLAELRERLWRERGLLVAISTLWRLFERHRPGAQEKTAHAAEQGRDDLKARHLAWFERQPDLDPERLVFIDETGATTKMATATGQVRALLKNPVTG